MKLLFNLSLLFIFSLIHGQPGTKQFGNRPQSSSFKKNFESLQKIKDASVFIAEKTSDTTRNIYCSGSIIKIKGIFYLLSAKHCFVDLGSGTFIGKNPVVLFNGKSGNIEEIVISEVISKTKLSFVSHSQYDIILFPLISQNTTGIRSFYLDSNLITDEYFGELDEVFYMSYQPQIQPINKLIPVIRTGTISAFLPDNTFLIDGFVFGGNSGSAVLLKPSLLRSQAEGTFLGLDDPNAYKIAGVIQGFISDYEINLKNSLSESYTKIAGNTGLSRVWPSRYIIEIINSESFKLQLSKLKGAKQ